MEYHIILCSIDYLARKNYILIAAKEDSMEHYNILQKFNI